ncbi:MAG TPA: hypothetical protein ENF95_00570 [Candidatus Aenigmarchaeota archaeon]|nr:hypothetical protein [Candidatus Aenigmarchaeota archaeon]
MEEEVMIFKLKKKKEEKIEEESPPLGEEDFFISFDKLEEVSEKKETQVKLAINKEKIIYTTIEGLIIIYFILAVLGYVPFF